MVAKKYLNVSYQCSVAYVLLSNQTPPIPAVKTNQYFPTSHVDLNYQSPYHSVFYHTNRHKTTHSKPPEVCSLPPDKRLSKHESPWSLPGSRAMKLTLILGRERPAPETATSDDAERSCPHTKHPSTWGGGQMEYPEGRGRAEITTGSIRDDRRKPEQNG